MASTDGDAQNGEPQCQRLDKWLWFARVAKTRTLASNFVSAGKVRVNKIKIEKPGSVVKVGDVITIAAHSRIRVLRVLAAGNPRGPATEAALLFEDISPPAPSRAHAGTPFAHSGGRPSKKERRDFESLRRRDGPSD